METRRSRVTAKHIHDKLQDEMNLSVTHKILRKIMKEDMRLKWRKISHQGEYVNSPQNIIKRKKYAIGLLNSLNEGKIIINYDESIIGGTTSWSYSWERRKDLPGRVIKRQVTGISIFLSVSSDGVKFF